MSPAAHQYPRPPALDVALTAGAGEAWRVTWWFHAGLWHGARRGTGADRALSAVMGLLWWPMLPVLLPVQAVLMTNRRARYYMTPQRDAVLAVIADHHGWRVEGHAAARPGTGRGRALRAALLPDLVAAADTHQVPIHTTAATRDLAALYAHELTGLVDIGRGVPRGRRLRRDPAR